MDWTLARRSVVAEGEATLLTIAALISRPPKTAGEACHYPSAMDLAIDVHGTGRAVERGVATHALLKQGAVPCQPRVRRRPPR